MSVTFDVFQPLTSTLVSALQSLNIEFMLVTFDVSQPLTSILVNTWQSLNIEFIFSLINITFASDHHLITSFSNHAYTGTSEVEVDIIEFSLFFTLSSGSFCDF